MSQNDKYLDILKETQQELNTQDNLCTAHPLFVVYDYEKIPVDPDYSDQKLIRDDEYEEIDYSTVLERVKGDSRVDQEFVDFDSEYEVMQEAERLRIAWEEHFAKIKVFKNAFFTRKSAQRFIDGNKHHFKEPFIYVESLWRNHEMQTIREELMEREL